MVVCVVILLAFFIISGGIGFINSSKDVVIQADMSQLSYSAENYYASRGTFSDLCTNDPDFVNSIISINKISGKTAACLSLTTDQSGDNLASSSACGSEDWVVVSPLIGRNGKWCVDSAGAKQLLSSDCSATSCSCAKIAEACGN